MNVPTNILEGAEMVVTVKSTEELPLTNIALELALTGIRLKGYYDCIINGVKKLFILESLTQQQFYGLYEVQHQTIIQKHHKHGSATHKRAHTRIGELAKKHGVWEQYQASNGCVY